MIYLDHNATSPLLPIAREAMLRWLGPPANPASVHRYGQDAAMAVDEARQAVAAMANWSPSGVIFTSGATEANATVLSRGRWAAGATEHPSVLAWATEILPVDGEGIVQLDPRGEIDGVSIHLANNETGVIQPIAEFAAYARRRGWKFHVDAAQAPGRIPVRVDADFVTLSAHKLGGPAGVGALLVRGAIEPLLRGGPQERGWRAGTHAVASIAGFGAAASVAGTMSSALRDRLEAAVGGRVIGRGRLPNTSCIVWEGVDAADLVVALDLAGVAVSAGAACASGSMRKSHVLQAMGVEGSGVRFSLGPQTTAAEVEEAIRRVALAVTAAR